MLDRDLAEMYGVETRIFNQSVKRNIDRFPEDFMFTLTDKEWSDLKSQIVTSSWGGIRYKPKAFTEQGVAMLSGVLSSKKAIAVNIQIIRIFTRLRASLLTNKDILLKLEQLDKQVLNLGFDVKMHDGEIETIFELVKEIMEAKQQPTTAKNPIGFKVPKK